MAGKAPKEVKQEGRIGPWHMLRDVLVTAMHKGQLIPVLCAIMVVVFLLRLPPVDLAALGREIVHGLQSGSLIGWCLFVLISGAWTLFSRQSTRRHGEEMRRITREKSELQEKALKNKAESSEL